MQDLTETNAFRMFSKNGNDILCSDQRKPTDRTPAIEVECEGIVATGKVPPSPAPTARNKPTATSTPGRPLAEMGTGGKTASPGLSEIFSFASLGDEKSAKISGSAKPRNGGGQLPIAAKNPGVGQREGEERGAGGSETGKKGELGDGEKVMGKVSKKKKKGQKRKRESADLSGNTTSGDGSGKPTGHPSDTRGPNASKPQGAAKKKKGESYAEVAKKGYVCQLFDEDGRTLTSDDLRHVQHQYQLAVLLADDELTEKLTISHSGLRHGAVWIGFDHPKGADWFRGVAANMEPRVGFSKYILYGPGEQPYYDFVVVASDQSGLLKDHFWKLVLKLNKSKLSRDGEVQGHMKVLQDLSKPADKAKGIAVLKIAVSPGLLEPLESMGYQIHLGFGKTTLRGKQVKKPAKAASSQTSGAGQAGEAVPDSSSSMGCNTDVPRKA